MSQAHTRNNCQPGRPLMRPGSLFNTLLCSAFCFLLSPLAAAQATAKLILIIDDIGNNRQLGQRTVDLPGPLNLAFLPHTPFASRLAEKAHQAGHGIMLHAPMANKNNAKLGPGALTSEMTPQQWHQVLVDNISAIPHVSGVNNHMGSELTENPRAMRQVMRTLQQQGLFFVDSLTTARSIAAQQAQQAHLPSLKRDVFLDHSTEPQAIARQFRKAIQLAKQRGMAVAIGHPYPQTLHHLEQVLPTLAAQDIELVSARQYLYQQLWQQPLSVRSKYQLQPFRLPALQPRSQAQRKRQQTPEPQPKQRPQRQSQPGTHKTAAVN